jgi:DNA-binding CsgD family transcriptional regulator
MRKSNQLLLEKQQVEFELKRKINELMNETLKKTSIQSFKESVHAQLKEILQDIPPMHRSAFKPLITKVSPRSKVVQQEFEERFDAAHLDFSEKLRSIAPDLNALEIRLCALMRLDISSKELAVLINRSSGTVDNMRSRIRKKLMLGNHESITQFLKGI